MSGLVPKDAAPSRDDHMSGEPPESSTTRQQPKNAASRRRRCGDVGLPPVLQSVLESAGPQAARIEWLWWLMFWVALVRRSR